jgi:hypothetical protein
MVSKRCWCCCLIVLYPKLTASQIIIGFRTPLSNEGGQSKLHFTTVSKTGKL